MPKAARRFSSESPLFWSAAQCWHMWNKSSLEEATTEALPQVFTKSSINPLPDGVWSYKPRAAPLSAFKLLRKWKNSLLSNRLNLVWNKIYHNVRLKGVLNMSSFPKKHTANSVKFRQIISRPWCSSTGVCRKSQSSQAHRNLSISI